MWFENDVSGLPIGNIFKGEAVEEARPLKMETTGTPKTSVLNLLTPRNNSESGKIQVRESNIV
jgi:hypothetical protein